MGSGFAPARVLQSSSCTPTYNYREQTAPTCYYPYYPTTMIGWQNNLLLTLSLCCVQWLML